MPLLVILAFAAHVDLSAPQLLLPVRRLSEDLLQLRCSRLLDFCQRALNLINGRSALCLCGHPGQLLPLEGFILQWTQPMSHLFHERALSYDTR